MVDERKILNDLRCCTISGERDCANCTQTNWLSCRDSLMRGALELIESQKTETEKLKEELADARYLNTVAKYDGIEEFAERLKERVAFEAQDKFMIVTRTRIDGWIDDIVEEMTEGE